METLISTDSKSARERAGGEQWGGRKRKEGKRRTDWPGVQRAHTRSPSKGTVAALILSWGQMTTSWSLFPGKVRISTLWITHTDKVLEVCLLFLTLPSELLSAYCIQGTRRVWQIGGTAQILPGFTRQKYSRKLHLQWGDGYINELNCGGHFAMYTYVRVKTGSWTHQ